LRIFKRLVHSSDIGIAFNQLRQRPFQNGLGLYNVHLTTEGGGIKEDTSESDFGLNGGGGIDLKSNPSMHLGVGGMYHYVFSQGSATQYVNLSLYLTFTTNGATK